jgi:hypothetical protein
MIMQKTNKRHYCIAIMLVFFLASLPAAYEAFAQSDMFIYPKEGQSNEQLERDKYECYGWSKKQTGFDPMEVPTATAPPPKKERKKGGALKGAAGGALLGAGIGAIAGDTGKGAAIGAVSGGVFGGARRQNQKKQEAHAQQQWEQDQASQYSQRRNQYNRAYSACLEARGYTVK